MLTKEISKIGLIEFKEFHYDDYKYESHNWAKELNDLTIDLIIKTDNIDDLNFINFIIDDFEEIEQKCKKFYTDDFHKKEVTLEYIQDWIYMLEETNELAILTKSKTVQEQELDLKNKLKIVHIVILNKKDEKHLVLDFAFGYEDDMGFREHMLVLCLDEKFNLTGITIEG